MCIDNYTVEHMVLIKHEDKAQHDNKNKSALIMLLLLRVYSFMFCCLVKLCNQVFSSLSQFCLHLISSFAHFVCFLNSSLRYSFPCYIIKYHSFLSDLICAHMFLSFSSILPFSFLQSSCLYFPLF